MPSEGRCRECNAWLTSKPRGRMKKYCNSTCRSAAGRRRKTEDAARVRRWLASRAGDEIAKDDEMADTPGEAELPSDH